ncbi:MAG TPA: iron-containing redox enzyme family protein [Vicinamibacterales bacterium]|nr:iron-containing redox enzyme family protein [Vicinamibacterales bacterium]
MPPRVADLRPSRVLRAKIRMASPRLEAVALALWNHPEFARIYPAFLFHNHAVVRASVSLMKAACECAQTVWPHDAVAAPLAEYLRKHIPEETNHDEWVLEDLERLGVDRSAVLTRMPPATVATLVGAQYYWILHHHPIAVLGYIAVLEGTPPESDRIERVAQASGVPMDAFSTLLRHARLDPYHRDDLDRLLDRLPLSSSHASLLGVSAFHTVHWLGRVVEDALS